MVKTIMKTLLYYNLDVLEVRFFKRALLLAKQSTLHPKKANDDTRIVTTWFCLTSYLKIVKQKIARKLAVVYAIYAYTVASSVASLTLMHIWL